MSIDLDIGVLSQTIEKCEQTSQALEQEAGGVASSASSLGQSWQGEAYSSFSDAVNGHASPLASLASAACASLAEALEDVRRRAASLRARSEGFSSAILNGSVAFDSSGVESGRLFSDDACFDPIDADLANAEDAVEKAQKAFWEAEDVLYGLRTRSVAMDGGGFASGLARVSRGTAAFRQSFSAYRSGMAELESAAASAAAAIAGPFEAKSVTDIYEAPNVKDATALAWWLAQPYDTLSAEERVLVDALKAEGLSMPKIGGESVAAESDFMKLLDVAGAAAGASGDFAWVHEMLLSSIPFVVGKVAGTTSLSTIKPVKEEFKAAGNKANRISALVGLVSAIGSSVRYYDSHPELPDDARLNNAIFEFDIQAVGILIDFFVPLVSDEVKEFGIAWINSPNESGESIADEWRSIRYEQIGRESG